MRLALRILALAIVVLVALAAMAFQLPFLKEGYAWAEIPFVAAGGVGLLAVALAWWWGSGKRLAWAIPGWIVLAPPALAALAVSWQFAMAQLDGAQATREGRILGYDETPLAWPGFDGPVGLRVRIRIALPEGIDGHFRSPQLYMGPAIAVPRNELLSIARPGDGYLDGRYIDTGEPELMLLKEVLFDQTAGRRGRPARTIAEGTTTLDFDLYPGVIDLLNAPTWICLGAATPSLPRCAEDQKPQEGCLRKGYRRPAAPVANSGTKLSALWPAVGPNGLRIDLSRQLTATLRSASTLQGDPDAWQVMQRRMTPEGLTKAGYGLCPPGRHSHNGFRVCYCRE